MSLLRRAAWPDDHAAVPDLFSRIWEGHDYIPDGWGLWAADPNRQFTAVANTAAGGAVIGCCIPVSVGRLAALAAHPHDWYRRVWDGHANFYQARP